MECNAGSLALATASGLEMKGLATGAVVQGELSLLLYVGTSLHYFEAHLGAVEAMIDSIDFTTDS